MYIGAYVLSAYILKIDISSDELFLSLIRSDLHCLF
jgi:hypothetical protein